MPITRMKTNRRYRNLGTRQPLFCAGMHEVNPSKQPLPRAIMFPPSREHPVPLPSLCCMWARHRCACAPTQSAMPPAPTVFFSQDVLEQKHGCTNQNERCVTMCHSVPQLPLMPCPVLCMGKMTHNSPCTSPRCRCCPGTLHLAGVSGRGMDTKCQDQRHGAGRPPTSTQRQRRAVQRKTCMVHAHTLDPAATQTGLVRRWHPPPKWLTGGGTGGEA